MSTNIDHVEVLSGELTISEEGKAWLDAAKDGAVDWFPECGPEIGEDGKVAMGWSGTSSGNAIYYDVLEKFFSFTKGTAECVFHWRGIGREGYRVVDGVMTRHDVEMKLGKEVK